MQDIFEELEKYIDFNKMVSESLSEILSKSEEDILNKLKGIK